MVDARTENGFNYRQLRHISTVHDWLDTGNKSNLSGSVEPEDPITLNHVQRRLFRD